MSAELINKYSEKNSTTSSWAKKIVTNIKRTELMISNLLNANRIKAGEIIPLNIEGCNLYELAKEVSEDLATIYGDRIKLKSETDINRYWDRHAIIRIIENLLTNALKYGDPTKLETLTLDTIEDRVTIKVHNLVKVISEEDQALLFEPYQRSDSVMQSNIKGWGLGLTLVKGLTEAHHGVVRVESYPQSGTTFTVDLPLITCNKKDSSFTN